MQSQERLEHARCYVMGIPVMPEHILPKLATRPDKDKLKTGSTTTRFVRAYNSCSSQSPLPLYLSSFPFFLRLSLFLSLSLCLCLSVSLSVSLLSLCFSTCLFSSSFLSVRLSVSLFLRLLACPYIVHAVDFVFQKAERQKALSREAWDS